MRFQSNKESYVGNKLRGGYYTPKELADYMVRWAIRSGEESVLEPSCGDGNFVPPILDHLATLGRLEDAKACRITCIEQNATELAKAKRRTKGLNRYGSRICWKSNDFFDEYSQLANGAGFDVVLGNPPFIRFQYFNPASREKAFTHLRRAEYSPTKLANAWAAFVQLSIELLADGGRLAMVLPAELLQVAYANELRMRLSQQFRNILLVGFRKLVFPSIQQEVVLLLAEDRHRGPSTPCDIHTVEFQDGNDLLASDPASYQISHAPAKHMHVGMKWTSLFLSSKSYIALEKAGRGPSISRLGDLVSVQVGIVTGRNKFFILTKELKDQLKADRFCLPIVGRTNSLNSIIFRRSDYNRAAQQYPAYILDTNGVDESEFPKQLMEYIAEGEAAGVSGGYKCKIRERWYDVPSIYTPDGFMYRQIHQFPLLVTNIAKATSTDTIHRVRARRKLNMQLLSAACFNSLTLAWSEVGGRSYGGGVLELEPSEAEGLPVFYDDDMPLDPKVVDTLLRKNKVYEALDYVDDIVLRQCLGMKKMAMRQLRLAWEELRDRRIGRR